MPFIQTNGAGGEQVMTAVQLQEPSKMQQDALRQVLKHWQERQDQGLVPFAFTKILRGGEMVSALPLNVPPEALLPLSLGNTNDHNGVQVPENLLDTTLSPGSLDPLFYPSPSQSSFSPSPPPSSQNESSVITPETIPTPEPTPTPELTPTPEPTPTSPASTSPIDRVSAPAAPRPVTVPSPNSEVIDPIFPKLTEAQLHITGPQAFTTNALLGARITTHDERVPTFTLQPSSSGIATLNPDPNMSRLVEEYIKIHGIPGAPSNRHDPEDLPPVEKRKRGRPRKNLQVENSEDTQASPPNPTSPPNQASPPKKSQKIKPSAPKNNEIITPRPTPRPTP